jgi:outer membrane protein TolC
MKIASQLLLLIGLCLAIGCTTPLAQVHEAGCRDEQLTIQTRDPASLPPAPIPKVPPPVTVADAKDPREPWELSLNEAVRITLENAKAIRVYTGLGASNSGRTIYDAAIANTAIDQQQARFDPALTASKTRSRAETAGLQQGAFASSGFAVGGSAVDVDSSTVGVNKLNALGGRSGLNFVKDHSAQNRSGGSLNPEDRRALEVNYTQPLLQGGGFQFNQAPIVLARIDTERSYFQFKDATQELVRGTIEAYWNLVLARLELWAVEIQNGVAEEAFNKAEAGLKVGRENKGVVAQAQVTLQQFKAGLIAARATLLDREAALRNVLGLPTSDHRVIVPVSAPANVRYKADWENLLRFAEQQRPDIIELKLILEADQQRKIQAENFALPQVDATASYRWNGLSGRLPVTGNRISSDPGQFTDWTVGINFAVPLGLREGRARVREQDLIILRDKANLEQGLHATGHELAVTTRALENSFEQYLAYSRARVAAFENLILQEAAFREGINQVIFLNVLQALNDWGSVINSQARALVDYNILLANLERQTGTILETHGLVFVEERFRAAGPLCLPQYDREYPQELKPQGEPTKFPGTGLPGENAFDLKKPEFRPKKDEPKPPEKKEEPPPEEVKFAEERAK